jgi:hypothetical protein
LGRQGRARAMEHYSDANVAAGLLQFWHGLLPVAR